VSDKDDTRSSQRVRKISSGLFRIPKPAQPQAPPTAGGLRLRTKLVIAMVLAALVPVFIVAAIASGVILSNLEAGLRDDADRQLTVGLNLILRSIERLGDQAVQLSESSDLLPAIRDRRGLDAWLARQISHLPSARLQLLDPNGALVFDRMVVGALTCDPAQIADANHPSAARRSGFVPSA
jgi:hypothetical protein